MGMMLCDYQAESRTAAQMADAATSEIDRSDWLFLALAWQALARSYGGHGAALEQNPPAQAGVEDQLPQQARRDGPTTDA
ncbi:hypothetical protein [Bradyrhizobium sp. Tv2a-2]|uniref:hypothetical protein n=1 Tax=Bradyrhizobium sp. Tv2a-2 TaxID=113395 RepID=UPI0012EB42D4|nr:hypothetical protein [Bradyrhizobium sp. Tv2a-2]